MTRTNVNWRRVKLRIVVEFARYRRPSGSLGGTGGIPGRGCIRDTLTNFFRKGRGDFKGDLGTLLQTCRVAATSS